jgi:2-polyprenyl-3-methyl-5-hydroxy-6-metoxy-1,4-benzoquinol methylase
VTGIDYRRLYDYRLNGTGQPARQAVWTEIAIYLHQRMGSPERVLDVGAGRGEFITAVPAAERRAIDLHGFGGYHDGAVEAVAGGITDAELPSGYFDGAVMSNLLEHLPTQETVAAALARLREAMAPGGTVAVMGPNFRYCAREYFGCADHTLALTHVAVAGHLHAAGFCAGTVIPRFLPYSFRGRFPASPALTRHYLHHPVLWRLLGKQFLVTGTKPG